MAIPPYDCPPDVTPCCTSVYGIAEWLMTELLAAVNACIVDNGCDDCLLEGFVHVGSDFQRPTSDYLAVMILPIGLSRGSTMRSGTMPFPLPRASFGVKLLESGFPMPTEVAGQIVLPEAERITWATEHLSSHGERLYRTMLDLMRRHAVGLPGGFGATFQSVTELTPIPLSGGSAGWQFGLTVDLDW